MIPKIFKAVFFTTIIVLLVGLSVTLWLAHNLMLRNDQLMLTRYANELASITEAGGDNILKSVSSGNFRVTLIKADGTVLFDSQVNSLTMVNHSNRPEFKQALFEGHSEVERYSSTLGTDTMYYAVKLKSGEILRCAFTAENVFSITWIFAANLVIVMLVAGMFSAWLAHRISCSIVRPINELDLNHPLDNNVYDELAPLLRRIDSHQKKISALIEKVTRQSREMQVITRSMTEGLVLLNADGEIISINKSARQIFDIGDSVIGKSILQLDRSKYVRSLFDKSLIDGEHDEILELDNRFYQIYFNKIETASGLIGYALLVIDITESRQLQLQRQEFAANVSHELKTPLQSIIGRAELIESELVQPKDIKIFGQKIRHDGESLLALINDVIFLSKLDSGFKAATEQINLRSIALQVVSDLEEKAKLRNISLSVDGDCCNIECVSRYCHQVFFNLIDNAIKYNRDGGMVNISLADTLRDVTIKISDNGIGIPVEDQPRIFERFFCVDRSHSDKKGTGLGLSIVKHIVELYKGTIEVNSKLNQGSEFTIRLPKEVVCPQPEQEAV